MFVVEIWENVEEKYMKHETCLQLKSGRMLKRNT